MERKESRDAQIVKAFGLFALIFGVLFWQICDKMAEFSIITDKAARQITFLLTIICSILATFYIAKKRAPEENWKIFVWFSTHLATIDMCYVIPLLLVISMKPELVSSLEDLKNVVSLSWTIFSVTATVFLFWYVLIPEYLKKQAPYDNDSNQNGNGIEEKSIFYKNVSVFSNTATLVMITLCVLLCVTSIVYLSPKGDALIRQNFTRFSFYLCGNTLVLLFFDVLKPYNEEKKAMLQAVKVTSKEVDDQYKIEKKTDDLLTGQESNMEDEGVSE